VFIATAAPIYSLGHGLCTFTAVPRSTGGFKGGAGLYLSNFIRGVEVLAIEVDDRANA